MCGLVIDFPHSTKAKKYFLCLLAGPPDPDFQMPTAQGVDTMSVAGSAAPSAFGGAQRGDAARNEARKTHAKRKLDSRTKARKGRISKKSREWILIKKEAMRKQGREVTNDSKYTGRRRSKVRF